MGDKFLDIIPVDECEAELAATMTYQEGSFDLLAIIHSKTPIPVAPPATPTPAVPSPSYNPTRLPKIGIKKFDGQILNLLGFWDQFSSAVDARTDLRDINKFTYLISSLSGKAEEIIRGLALNADNYKKAVDILPKLTPVKTTSNVTGLRKLYDSIESSIRNLDALDIKVDQYGAVLIPLIRDRLPDDLKLVTGRKFKSNVWTLFIQSKES